MRPSLRSCSTVSLPPSSASARASSTALPMADEPQMKTQPDIFSTQCFTDIFCSPIAFCTYLLSLPSPGLEKAVCSIVRGRLGPTCMRARAAHAFVVSFTEPLISSLKSQSSSGWRQPKKSAAGACWVPRLSSSQKPLNGATPAPEPIMTTGTSFSGRWKGEARCLARTSSPAFSRVASQREQRPKKRLESTAGSAASLGMHPMSWSCVSVLPPSGRMWLVRLTQRVIFVGAALGDDAIVNSRGFCRGQCRRNSCRSRPATPSRLQNSCILQHRGAACSNFSASASARSFTTCSAAWPVSFGCMAWSIFFVGARPRSQYRERAWPIVHGVGKGRLIFALDGPSAGRKVMTLLASAGFSPRRAMQASTSAGSLSGSTERVPPSA
mmetsp:Transcript_33829/g.89669  ORF Transcript_33829/g.89669 Transcript_33829/m.89669 type:complete len:383 (+) Transcript_33829:679-1827(+)